ncbi:YrzI family small protein [Bacillus sp. Marseille-Q3570]|nr:YrzI family small protein [Bacillus sp. Marseille-Q3570]
MMPIHLFLLTIVQKTLKFEMTYEEINKKKHNEDLYEQMREKAFYYISMM